MEMRKRQITLVLILVVVEDVLVPNISSFYFDKTSRLNPCCSGRCSSTACNFLMKYHADAVLILVVVEDVLVPKLGGSLMQPQT